MERFKNLWKKTTAILMIAVLLIGVAPLGNLADVDWSELALAASAEELVGGDYEYTVENGEATITWYNGDGGDIVIPSELGGYPVTSIGDWAFAYCYSLTSVTIPDGVTSIGDYAFEWCTRLTKHNYRQESSLLLCLLKLPVKGR